ncbi:MAG TPA: hypothetical protein VMF52_14880 [Steroidobacteraceae bacterium]|nr:hypothetical protein [Steroidobacteraceae bacterium]
MRKLSAIAALVLAGAATAAEYSKPEVTVSLPGGWVEVPDAVLQQFHDEMKRQAPLANIPKYTYAFQSTDGPPWLTYPYLLVKVTPTGRPTEKELQDLPSIDLNDKFQEKSGDWSNVMKDTSLGKMRYDKAANVVWITSKSEVVGIGEVSGISGIIPTEKGFVELHAYAKTADFPAHFPTFEKIITGAKVAPDLQYKPSWVDVLPGPVSRFDFKQLGFALVVGLAVGVIFSLTRRKQG